MSFCPKAASVADGAGEQCVVFQMPRSSKDGGTNQTARAGRGLVAAVEPGVRRLMEEAVSSRQRNVTDDLLAVFLSHEKNTLRWRPGGGRVGRRV